MDEIDSFDKLKEVADDIQSRLDEINEELATDLTGAFTSTGLDDGSSWRFSGHLANMPLYYEFKDDGCDLIAGEGEIDGCNPLQTFFWVVFPILRPTAVTVAILPIVIFYLCCQKYIIEGVLARAVKG